MLDAPNAISTRHCGLHGRRVLVAQCSMLFFVAEEELSAVAVAANVHNNVGCVGNDVYVDVIFVGDNALCIPCLFWSSLALYLYCAAKDMT